MEFHRATTLHRLPFSFAIMHLGRGCGKEIFARRNRLGISDIVLLGEILLLLAGEKALEVFQSFFFAALHLLLKSNSQI